MPKKYYYCLGAVALIVNCLFFILVYTSSPNLFFDHTTKPCIRKNFFNPDAYHYYLMGHILLDKKVFSRDIGNPTKHPDFHRTPIYPLFLALLILLSGNMIYIYLVQMILYAVSAFLLMQITYMIVKKSAVAFLSGLLMVMNLSVYPYIYSAMSEILYIFLFMLALYLFMKFFTSRATNKALALIYLFASGILFGVSILTWPGLKFFIFVPVIVILFSTDTIRFKFASSLILILMTWLVLFPWLLRNHRQFGAWALADSQVIQLIYGSGSGAFSLKHHITIEQAQEMIAEEYNIPTSYQIHNFWMVPGLTPRYIYNKYKAVKMKVAFKYPAYLVLGAFLGIIKAHISNANNIFASKLNTFWTNPNFNNLLHGNISLFFKQLFSNKPIMLFYCVYQYLFMLILYAGTLYCFILLIRKRMAGTLLMWSGYGLFLLSTCYFLLILGVMSLEAYSRYVILAQVVYMFYAAHLVYMIKKD
ncbi:hypothetical protein J7L67_06395 [bacterium]|nr:hypothetical protein [bacterium]